MSEHCSVILFLLYMGGSSLLLGGTKAANFTLLNVYQPPHIEAEIGYTLNLTCEFNYTGDSDISEMMFGGFYTQNTTHNVAVVMCHQSVSKDTMSCRLSLTINPSPKDEDVYHCEVLIPRAKGTIEVRGSGTNLSVHAEPSSVEIRSAPFLVSRREAMLVCLASGFYPGNPSVLWVHRGLPVPPRAISTDIIREDDGTFYLHTAYRFIPTEEDHTGACVCQVSHPTWTQRWAVNTTLNVSAEPFFIGIQPLSHLVSGHESILLCTASRFFPGNPSVLWFHRNLPVPPSNITNDIIGENDGTFSLRSQYRFIPSEADHTAECFCQVAHPVWTGRRTVNITLDVLYGPSAVSVTSHLGSVANGYVSVVVGSTVNLTCSADGNPSPEIQWLSEDITKLNSSEYLYIASVLKEAEGLYWCVAQNQYGERNTSITLLVTYSAGVSTCLLVKLLLIGILILMDIIMFTIFIIMKTRTGRLEIPELSVSQPLQPQGESLAQSSNSHGT